MSTQEEMAKGHLWRFTVHSKTVFGVLGAEYRECDWWGPPIQVDVRAPSLPAALRIAADLPLSDWLGFDGEEVTP